MKLIIVLTICALLFANANTTACLKTATEIATECQTAFDDVQTCVTDQDLFCAADLNTLSEDAQSSTGCVQSLAAEHGDHDEEGDEHEDDEDACDLMRCFGDLTYTSTQVKAYSDCQELACCGTLGAIGWKSNILLFLCGLFYFQFMRK